MLWHRSVRTTYTKNKFMATLTETILSRLAALEAANVSERVPFTDVEGTIEIDFTVSSRNVKYVPEKALAYYVIDGKSVLVEGYSISIDPSSGLVSTLILDGLFGTGYVLLTN